MVGHGPEAIPARGDGGGGVGAPPLLLAQPAATVPPRCGHHAAMEGGQARDGSHARTGGGGRPGFATAVTTMEARGGTAVEAKRSMAVEQGPPSLMLRRNRRRRRSSLDGGPLLQQPNDDGHGSGCSNDLLPAWRR
jgi:hypothetical protein